MFRRHRSTQEPSHAGRLGDTVHGECKQEAAVHGSANRTEQKGDNVLKNLRALFAATKLELVEHGWTPHNEFMYALSHVNMAMHVSFTETFNIICA